MPYDERLGQRVATYLASQPEVVQRKMFGGLVFMLRGNMCCGIIKSNLIIRVSKSDYLEVLKLPHAAVMDFTGKPLTGFISVDPAGVKTKSQLSTWLDRAIAFCDTLPEK